MNKKSNQELASLIIIFVFGYSVMVFLLNYLLKPMMARRVEGFNPLLEGPPPGCSWYEHGVLMRPGDIPHHTKIEDFTKCCKHLVEYEGYLIEIEKCSSADSPGWPN